MNRVRFQEFQLLDLRIGKVIRAERVERSRNLLKLLVDFGDETMQAVAGLAQYYTPNELLDNKYLFICNLELKTMMGVQSECMILAAEDSTGNIVLICPERDVGVGSKVR